MTKIPQVIRTNNRLRRYSYRGKYLSFMLLRNILFRLVAYSLYMEPGPGEVHGTGLAQWVLVPVLSRTSVNIPA